jgi:hypothetical protein
MRIALLFAALTLLVTACTRGTTVPHGEDVDGGLEHARASKTPLYFVGRRFAGLPLTDVEVDSPGRGVFAYGTCFIPAGQDGGCSVPIQIQIFPFDPGQWSGNVVDCHRRSSLLGVPAVRHDGLVLFTGRSVVKVYARNAGEDRRVLLALRDVRRPGELLRRLPPAASEVAQAQAAVCT